MASKIVMEFESTSGSKKYTLNYANSEGITNAKIKAIMNAYLAATSLLNVTLTAAVSAYIETTTQTEFDLD